MKSKSKRILKGLNLSNIIVNLSVSLCVSLFNKSSSYFSVFPLPAEGTMEQVLFMVQLPQFVAQSVLTGSAATSFASSPRDNSVGGQENSSVASPASTVSSSSSSSSSSISSISEPSFSSLSTMPSTPTNSNLLGQPADAPSLLPRKSGDLPTLHMMSTAQPLLSSLTRKDSAQQPPDTIDVLEILVMVLTALSHELDNPSLVQSAFWFRHPDRKSYQVTFYSDCIRSTEIIWSKLTIIGVGTIFGNMAVLPLHALKWRKPKKERKDNNNNNNSPHESTASEENDDGLLDMGVVHNQVHMRIAKAAEFNFDYVMFLMTASVLAALGLATNNVVVVVASMLISPLMSPVIGATFGFVVKETHLAWRSVLVMLLGLVLSILMGLFVGLLMGEKYHEYYDWPTQEMLSRGDWHGLMIGLAIAIPSGVGAALSLLTANQSSLVGVAISASLLPPCVNCGLLLAYAIWLEETAEMKEALRMAGISFTLSVLNIICIVAFAGIAFKLKILVKRGSMEPYFLYLNRQIAELKSGQSHPLSEEMPINPIDPRVSAQMWASVRSIASGVPPPKSPPPPAPPLPQDFAVMPVVPMSPLVRTSAGPFTPIRHTPTKNRPPHTMPTIHRQGSTISRQQFWGKITQPQGKAELLDSRDFWETDDRTIVEDEEQVQLMHGGVSTKKDGRSYL
eukprot:g44712.t1